MLATITIAIIKIQEEKIDYDFSMQSEEEVFFNLDELENAEIPQSEYVSTNSENEKDEDYAVTMREYTYTIKKPELYGKQLKINVDEPFWNEDGNLYTNCTVRVSDALVTKCVIEKQFDDSENQVEFLDADKNPKSEFENGEMIIAKCPEEADFSYVDYKITVEFVYNNEKYKVAVVQGLPVSDPDVGRIEATFYKSGTDELLIGSEIKLERIVEDKSYLITKIESGTDGRIEYYMVPVGNYKLIKEVDGEEIESQIFEVKEGEKTKIEF